MAVNAVVTDFVEPVHVQLPDETADVPVLEVPFQNIIAEFWVVRLQQEHGTYLVVIPVYDTRQSRVA